MIARLPSRAAATPSAAATVDFPTPPLPVTKIARLSRRLGAKTGGGTLSSAYRADPRGPGVRAVGRNRLSECEYPCGMGLLQRFARPEYRPGAPESPAEEERREHPPAAEPETTSAPPPGEADQGGGSVYGSDGFSQEAAIGNDAAAEAPASQ